MLQEGVTETVFLKHGQSTSQFENIMRMGPCGDVCPMTRARVQVRSGSAGFPLRCVAPTDFTPDLGQPREEPDWSEARGRFRQQRRDDGGAEVRPLSSNFAKEEEAKEGTEHCIAEAR